MTLRAVLDTNVLVSGLGWSGPSARIVDAAFEGHCTLIISDPLLDELRRVLAYPKLAGVFPDLDSTLRLITDVAEVRHLERTVHVVVDEADNRVLETAVAGRADYIVTGDAGLLELGEFETIPIVTPAKFWTILCPEG